MFLKSKKSKQLIYYVRTTSIINDSRASKEICSLIKSGFDVKVLGWDRDRRIQDYKDIKIEKLKINSEMFKFRASYGESLKTVVGIFLFQIWLFLKLLFENKKILCIHACDFDTGFVSKLICKIFKKKLVYDMYDYYTDSRPMSKKLEKLVNKLENSVISFATVSIICGEWRKKQINDAKYNDLLVIHNTPSINNIKNENLLKSNSKKLKIVYVGIFQDNRLLLEIIDTIKNYSEYELHIGGFGKYEEKIESYSKKYKNIFYYGSLKYEDVLCLESKCDVLFATYDPKIKNHKYSAPNKVYESMALGKPIIVCKNTGIDQLVLKNKIGYAIDYNACQFIDVLNNIRKNENIDTISKNCKKLYKELYSWDIMEKRLIEKYKQILKGEKK